MGFVHDHDPRRMPAGEAREYSASQVERVQAKGYGVFFTPNAMGNTPNPDPNKKLLRHDANVIAFNACFVDLDSGTKEEQKARIQSMTVEPSFIIESGRGFHAYFMLSETPATRENAALWRGVQQSMAEAYGGDKKVCNPSRLMRLPGSKHLKNPATPFEVSIVRAKDLQYDLVELELLFPPTYKPKFDVSWNTTKKSVRMPPIRKLLPGERHGTLLEVAGRLYNRLESDSFTQAKDTLKAWYVMSCVELKPDWEMEVNDVCDWMEQKERSNV